MEAFRKAESQAAPIPTSEELDRFQSRSGWRGPIHDLQEEVERSAAWVPSLQAEMARVIVGQRYLVDRLIVGLLTNGHLLLEGVPGLAKTLALKTLAETVSGALFRRLQFTPDMLPADIVGTMIYNPHDGSFVTKHGPIFSNLVLADEINRAPAKVQSALLEAMQERQVTLGEETYRLPEPFLVLATQNPIEQEGTYPLPEAQVDRFLLKLVIGYPSRAEERAILDAMATSEPNLQVEPVVSIAQLRDSRARRQSRLRRRQDPRLHRRHRLGDARSGGLRGAGARLHPVRRLAARDHRADAGGARVGLHARARLRHPARRQDAGARRAAPSARPVLRSRSRERLRRRRRGQDPRRAAEPVMERPMETDLKEILKQVRRIDIRTRRLANDAFAGRFHSVFRGRGMDFDEVREYVPGDEVRTIDWNVTARAGHPFVKKYREERELTILLAVDVSASGDFGSAGRTKREIEAEIACVLALSAVRNSDRVGLRACSRIRSRRSCRRAKGVSTCSGWCARS